MFAAVAATCGLVRGLAVEIGFGPASGPWPVWRLAGHGMGTAGFRRFRMSADCGHLPDRLFPRTDSGIGRRNRIRYEVNTGIDVCPAVRQIDDNQRTLVFRRFRLGAGVDCPPQRRYSWTDSKVGRRDRIWTVDCGGIGDVSRCAAGERGSRVPNSAVFGWVRFAAVCCGGRPCGLDRESDVETRSSPRRECGRC